MSRLLVTGGLGFIGSHVVEQALAQGYQVAVLDDLSTGQRSNVPEHVEVFQVDLRHAEETRQAVMSFAPTLISHQAAQASVPSSFKSPQYDAAVNVLGTLNLLEAAREAGVERVVMASTGGAIYGEIPEGQVGYAGGPISPSTPYAVSKLAGEQYLGVYRQHHGLNIGVLRYSNVYGERQSVHGEAGVIAIFCERLLGADPLQVFGRQRTGDSGCIRDYIYVGDVARANLLALQGKLPALFDVATGLGTDTLSLAKLLINHSDQKVQILMDAPRPGDVQRSILDGRPLKQVLGTVVPLSEGLTRTLAWYRASANNETVKNLE